ncbi:hypothetical protein [Fibrobacter sp.]|jgi:hypothetical protein
MIQDKLKWLLFFLGIALAGCALDSGYNPNSFDDDADIDYILDSLPLCTGDLEGYVFLYAGGLDVGHWEDYVEKVITCVEGEWFVLRDLEEHTPDIDKLPHFTVPGKGMR